MNAHAQNQPPAPLPSFDVAPVLPIGCDDTNASSAMAKPRRRRGKIALLPKTIRDQINLLLDDGLPYRTILEHLQRPGAPPLPYPITEHNLSEWKDGGYQDWLKKQFWEDELRARHDAFTNLLAGADPVQLPESGLQLAAVGICELLRDLSSPTTESEDPDKYIRAANSLARLSRSILQVQHYRDTCARVRAALQELKDPNRKLSESETRAIVRQVDEILGLNSEADEKENPKSEEQPRVVTNGHGLGTDTPIH